MKTIRRRQLYPGTLALLSALAFAPAVNAENALPHWPMVHEHEDPLLTKFMLDRFERRDANTSDYTYWEAQAWMGYDLNKLWLKTEGARSNGATEDADVEIYYSRAVAAFWDAQVGLRHDFSTTDQPSRDWFGAGFKGLAPYLFEVDATAYIGDEGRTALRLKAEYDLWLTQNWVFMPEVELNAYGKADPERNIGSGLSDASLTLRVRYDIRREFAPYIGVMWSQKYSGTADYARAGDEPVSETSLLAGVRAWW